MADFKTTNIYGDIYVNNKVGINTNVPATRLQIGQLSPTSVTEGLQFGDDPGTRIYRSAAGTLTLSGSVAGLTLSASTALYGNYGDWSGEVNKIQWHSNNLYFVNRGGGSWLFRNSGGSNVVSFSSAGAIDALSIQTTNDGPNLTMAGSTNAEGIRMQAASSATYPVFLKSINPGSGGESSPWIYRENSPDWGIWHNNPLNTIDFTKQGSGGIANNVGGSSSNTVMVRVDMANGIVQTSGPITGSAFSGSGTGLTGTAAGLSIGGSAASATSATSASYALNSTTAANVNNGTLTISTGTGIGVGTTTTFTANQSGNSTITLSNTGVTSAVAGTGVGVSAATGPVTFSIGQAVGTGNTPTFAGATLNGNLISNATLGGITPSPFYWDGSSATYWWIKVANLNTTDAHAALLISTKTDTNYVPYGLFLLSLSTWNNNSISIKLDSLISHDITVSARVDNNGDVWIQSVVAWNSNLSIRYVNIIGSPTLYTGSFVSSSTVPTNSVVIYPGQSLRGSQGSITASVAGNAPAHTFGEVYSRGKIFTDTFFQTTNGNIKSDTSFALLTTGNGAQSVSAKGILLGTSYDTTPGANEIRTTNNTSLYLNARGTGDIQFQTADSLKMMLLNNGNLGIGTSSPSSLLHAYGSDGRFFTYSGTSGAFTIQRNVLSTGAATPQLTLINTQGTDFVNRGTSIQFDLGYGGSSSTVGTAARGARIAALSETGYSATAANQNAYLAFSTATAGVLTEKLRIRSDGSISPITVSSTTAGATLIKADGTNGTLFSVVDDLSDSLLSVNNGAGLPVFEVFADDRIVAGQYGQNDFVIVNNKVGIGTNNPIAELHVTSSTSIPSALFLGGNVGIGTTNPVYRLQVSGQTFLNNGTSNALQIQTVVADTTTRDAIYLYEDSSAATGRQAISWYNGNQSYYKARLWTEVGANYQATQFGIDVADDARTVATRLLIRNGNVGIGTTLPQALLHVNGLISGSSFSGAGTGLTGTAANLSIGGSAGSATSATSAGYITSLGSNLNYEPYSGSRATLFKTNGLSHYTGYSTGTNRPTTFDYTLQVGNGSAGWEISMDWISLSGPAIFARSVRDCCQGWSQWVRILDSVNYAFAANMNQNVRTTDNPTFGTVTATLSGNASSATSASYALNSTNAVNVTGTVAIANGGTGATTAAQARTNLGAGTGNGTVTSVATGDGLSGGPIATTGTITVDSTVVRTTGNQTIAGNKTFTGTSIVTGSIETAAVRETFAAVTTNTTVSIDLSTATVFNLSFTGTISKFNITNVNTAKVNSFTLISAPGAGAATISWTFQTNGLNEANVKWAGSAPTATTTTNRWDIFSFVYNGSAWYGFTGGLNYV